MKHGTPRRRRKEHQVSALTDDLLYAVICVGDADKAPPRARHARHPPG
jgi:hypothetical protein